MRTTPGRIVATLLAMLSLAPVASRPAFAQQIVTPVATTEAPLPQRPLSRPELDQLLAPIALYPDQLLGQILMAAAYPLEIVMADRWVQDPYHRALRGDALAAALAPVDWDPSVKALVPFPQVLSMMDKRLDWTRRLGDAFIAQQGDVMDTVQRLRRRAAIAGSLRSTPQQTVTPAGPDYVITPANPSVVYVPVYDPALVYGAWPYPDYPPYAFALPPRFYIGPPVVREVRFSIGFTVVRRFWDWDDCDWDHHRLRVDRDRYEAIDHHFIRRDSHVRFADGRWHPNDYHRRIAAAHEEAPSHRPSRATAPARVPSAREVPHHDASHHVGAVRRDEHRRPAATPAARAAEQVRHGPEQHRGNRDADRAHEVPHAATARPAATPAVRAAEPIRRERHANAAPHVRRERHARHADMPHAAAPRPAPRPDRHVAQRPAPHAPHAHAPPARRHDARPADRDRRDDPADDPHHH